MYSYNIIKLILLAVFVLGDDSLLASTNNYNRIVGGHLTRIESQPYQVALYSWKFFMYFFYCGGSIIDANWVLTAAHCCESKGKTLIKAGTTDICEGEFSSKSDEIYIHPDYNPETFDNDVCLLKLTESLDLDGRTTEKVELADSDDDVEIGETLRVVGWGSTTEKGHSTCKLLGTRVNVISKGSCETDYGRKFKTHICAGRKSRGRDTCQGDSGGALVTYHHPKKQIGIVSYGIGCGQATYSGAYTFIPAVRNWIRSMSGI